MISHREKIDSVYIPDEILLLMASFFATEDLLRFSMSSRRMHRVLNDAILWKNRLKSEYPQIFRRIGDFKPNWKKRYLEEYFQETYHLSPRAYTLFKYLAQKNYSALEKYTRISDFEIQDKDYKTLIDHARENNDRTALDCFYLRFKNFHSQLPAEHPSKLDSHLYHVAIECLQSWEVICEAHKASVDFEKKLQNRDPLDPYDNEVELAISVGHSEFILCYMQKIAATEPEGNLFRHITHFIRKAMRHNQYLLFERLFSHFNKSETQKIKFVDSLLDSLCNSLTEYDPEQSIPFIMYLVKHFQAHIKEDRLIELLTSPVYSETGEKICEYITSELENSDFHFESPQHVYLLVLLCTEADRLDLALQTAEQYSDMLGKDLDELFYAKWLEAAVKLGANKILKYLIKKYPFLINQQNNQGTSLITLALERAHFRTLILLLENGKNPLQTLKNAFDFLMLAEPPLENFFSWRNAMQMVMQIIAKTFTQEQIAQFISQDDDHAGWTFLHACIATEDIVIALEMLKIAPELINVAPDTNTTPLNLAIRLGHVEITRHLLKMGADPRNIIIPAQLAETASYQPILNIILTHAISKPGLYNSAFIICIALIVNKTPIALGLLSHVKDLSYQQCLEMLAIAAKLNQLHFIKALLATYQQHVLAILASNDRGLNEDEGGLLEIQPHQFGNDYETSLPLILAARHGALEVLQWAHEMKSITHCAELIHEALSNHHYAVVKFLLPLDDSEKNLLRSIDCRDDFEFLLKENLIPTCDNFSPGDEIFRFGHFTITPIDLLELLLKYEKVSPEPLLQDILESIFDEVECLAMIKMIGAKYPESLQVISAPAQKPQIQEYLLEQQRMQASFRVANASMVLVSQQSFLNQRNSVAERTSSSVADSPRFAGELCPE